MIILNKQNELINYNIYNNLNIKLNAHITKFYKKCIIVSILRLIIKEYKNKIQVK